jgi:hypothetical protein
MEEKDNSLIQFTIEEAKKRLLAGDEWIPLILVFGEDGVHHIVAPFQNEDEKVNAWALAGVTAVAHNAHLIAFVCDTYILAQDHKAPIPTGSLAVHPNRWEGISAIIVGKKQSDDCGITVIYKRTAKGIEFEEEKRSDMGAEMGGLAYNIFRRALRQESF